MKGFFCFWNALSFSGWSQPQKKELKRNRGRRRRQYKFKQWKKVALEMTNQKSWIDSEKDAELMRFSLHFQANPKRFNSVVEKHLWTFVSMVDGRLGRLWCSYWNKHRNSKQHSDDESIKQSAKKGSKCEETDSFAVFPIWLSIGTNSF